MKPWKTSRADLSKFELNKNAQRSEQTWMTSQ